MKALGPLVLLVGLSGCLEAGGACVRAESDADSCFDAAGPEQCGDDFRAGSTCAGEGFTVDCLGSLYPDAYACDTASVTI